MNTVIQIIFFILSALIIGSGVMVVVARNIIHAALFLIASFAGVAALYFLLEAPFIGVVQVLVYAGAVSILVLFAIMLTRQVTGEATRQLFERWWVAAVVAFGLFALVLAPSLMRPNLPNPQADPAAPSTMGWPRVDLAQQPAPEGAITPPVGNGTGIAGAFEIGRSFMSEFLLPFEVASVLLLVALIGAVVIAYEERSRRRRVLTLAEETAMRRAASAPVSATVMAASENEPGSQTARTARTY